jgi:hypothetical protein
MFTGERAKFEDEHCAKWDRTFQEGIAMKAGEPRFLAIARDWIEFRRLAVQRQWRYQSGSSDADASEPPADQQFDLIL